MKSKTKTKSLFVFLSLHFAGKTGIKQFFIVRRMPGGFCAYSTGSSRLPPYTFPLQKPVLSKNSQCQLVSSLQTQKISQYQKEGK